jgi:hypothetical protein
LTFDLLPPDNSTVGCSPYGGNKCIADNGTIYYPGGSNVNVEISNKGKLEYKSFWNIYSKVYTVEMPYVDRLPEGSWTLNIDNETYGLFTLSPANAFDNSTGTPKFLALKPYIKAIIDNGIITALKVKWYTENDNGDKLVDKEYIDSLVREIIISYVDDSNINPNGYSYNFSLTDLEDNDTVFVYTPRNPNAPQPEIDYLDRIIFGYTIGDAKYQFFLEKPSF